MSFPVSHVFILSLLLFSYTISVTSVILFNYEISISNTTPYLVDTNCTVAGENVGPHPLRFNEVYNLSIPIVVKGDNTIVCNMAMHSPGGDKTGDFLLFDFNRDGGSCENNVCHLNAEDEALCFVVDESCRFRLYWNLPPLLPPVIRRSLGSSPNNGEILRRKHFVAKSD